MSEHFATIATVLDALDAQPLHVTKASIAYRGVNFSYTNNCKKEVKNFHLIVPGGQRLAIVGPSGAGKTTLVNLLARYFDPQQGVICIDDQDIKLVTQESLRGAIAIVSQDVDIFSRTVWENIAIARPDATQEEIIQAATDAHALEFIMKLPQGFDTVVGSRGMKLSVGQRQRLGIARAFLSKAPIVVLDEATSALDSETESHIKAAIATLLHNRTCITIAHRLSTIMQADRIVVLRDGEIVEDGTHAGLLQEGGLYASLWSHQSGGYIE